MKPSAISFSPYFQWLPSLYFFMQKTLYRPSVPYQTMSDFWSGCGSASALGQYMTGMSRRVYHGGQVQGGCTCHVSYSICLFIPINIGSVVICVHFTGEKTKAQNSEVRCSGLTVNRVIGTCTQVGLTPELVTLYLSRLARPTGSDSLFTNN